MIGTRLLSVLRGVRVLPAPLSLFTRTLRYDGLSRPVLLRRAAPVEAGLAAVMRGWHPTAARNDSPPPIPLTEVRRISGGFQVLSTYMASHTGRMPLASAVCGVLADLSQAWFEERPGAVALHCGAVRVGGHLIALAGQARAGKSTLIARLTAEPDMQVFCDDVLPVHADGSALALGIAPRLRLPLPDAATPVFRDHVAARMVLADDRYGYVVTPNLAPHGTTAPLAAFVILSRTAGEPARLHRMDPFETVEHLLLRNMARPGEGSALFDQMMRMAETLFCARLVYSDLEEAVGLIRSAFGGPVLPDPSVTLHPALPRTDLTPPPTTPADPGLRWRRSPDVALRRLEGDLVLWHRIHLGAFRLNPVAAAIWTLLEDPLSGAEAAALLAEAFPGEPRDRIGTDVAALLGALRGAGLILPA